MQKEITARLEARLPMEVHAMLKRAAEIQGRTLTDFVVSAASLNLPPANAALRRAFRHRRKLLGPAR